MIAQAIFRRAMWGLATAATAAVLTTSLAGARDIRPPLQATINAQVYEADAPAGPVTVRPISDTAENERVVQSFYDAFELTGQEVSDTAALTIAFDTEVIWPYRRRSTLTSQHLNSSVNRDPASYSSSRNVDFRVLGDDDQGDIRLPTYKLTVELRQVGRVVWRAEALSSHTNAEPDWVFRQMVPVVLETVNTTVEGETYFLE